MRAPVAVALGALLVLVGVGLPATARADCELGLVDFGSAINTVRLSLNNGHATGAAGVIDELHGNVDCLRFAPPPQLWADWLFLVALTRYAQERDDWSAPMDRALALNPNLDRGMIGTRHELYDYAPPAVHTASRVLPYDRPELLVYVDGVLVDNALADPDGFHLIQINNGIWWDSMIVEGGRGRDDLWVPRRQPQPVRFWAAGFGSLGLGESSWTLPSSDERHPRGLERWNLGLRGQVTVGALTARGQASLDESAEAPVYGVVGVDAEGFGIGIGAAAERFEIDWTFVDPTAGLQVRWYADPAAAAWIRSSGPRAFDARALATLTRLGLNAGVWPQRSRDPSVRYRVGLSGALRRTWLVDTLSDPDGGPGEPIRYRATSRFVGLEVAIQLVERDVATVTPGERREAP